MRLPRLARVRALPVLMAAAAVTASAAATAAEPASAATATAQPASGERLLAVDSVQLPERIVRTAYGFLGASYARGGTGETGASGVRAFDCSGLVYRTFLDAAAIELPRSVSGLLASGRAAPMPLHVGDLLFFDTLESGAKGAPDHVGIYAGGGRFVHAASEGPHRGVTVSSLDQDYYRSRFTAARRLLAWNAPTMEIDVTEATVRQPSRVDLSARLPSGTPLRLTVSCDREGGRFVALKAFRDGQEAFVKRLRAGPEAPGSAIIVPATGAWLVTVALPGDQVLAEVRFTVGE